MTQKIHSIKNLLQGASTIQTAKAIATNHDGNEWYEWIKITKETTTLPQLWLTIVKQANCVWPALLCLMVCKSHSCLASLCIMSAVKKKRGGNHVTCVAILPVFHTLLRPVSLWWLSGRCSACTSKQFLLNTTFVQETWHRLGGGLDFLLVLYCIHPPPYSQVIIVCSSFWMQRGSEGHCFFPPFTTANKSYMLSKSHEMQCKSAICTVCWESKEGFSHPLLSRTQEPISAVGHGWEGK